MDRKDTLVSTEDDKDREELHIRNALKSCYILLYTTFGFVFVNVAAFRRSKSISKPNFVQISQWAAEI